MMTDPRNQHVKHYINGRFVSQYEAAIPLFDAGFLHGKQVWSAPRLINNHIFRFQDHLDKIRHSAEINFFPDIPSDEVIIAAVRETLTYNRMNDGVHVRILVTPGTQVTASMDLAAIVDWHGKPRKPQVIVMPEYRGGVYDSEAGIDLVTSSFRRPGPDTVDQTSHDNNQNASSRALAEAKRLGATSALMYDPEGYLAEAPASHVAIVKDGRFLTPHVRCCPPGVTRQVLLEACTILGVESCEADLTSENIEQADEIMLLGTMSGPVGAVTIDQKQVGSGVVGPVTRRLQHQYQQMLMDHQQGYAIFDGDLQP